MDLFFGFDFALPGFYFLRVSQKMPGPSPPVMYILEYTSQMTDGELTNLGIDENVDLDFIRQRQQLLKSKLCNYAENII